MLTENYDRISVGGIKLSEELVQVSVDLESCDTSTSALLHQITAKQISLVSLNHSCTHSENRLLLTVFKADSEGLSISRGIGSLSVFPHRYDFAILSSVFCFFTENDFPIYSLSTSISAISINTDYSLYEAICNILDKYFLIPENHAPFRQQFRVRQIPPEDGNGC